MFQLLFQIWTQQNRHNKLCIIILISQEDIIKKYPDSIRLLNLDYQEHASTAITTVNDSIFKLECFKVKQKN